MMPDARFNGMHIHNPCVLRNGFCSGASIEDDTDGRPVSGWDRSTADHPCRGHCGVLCLKGMVDPLHDCSSHADDELKFACWRYAYRRHLSRVKETHGFMLQLRDENQELGKGQKIEMDMASELNVDVMVVQADCQRHTSCSGTEHVNEIAQIMNDPDRHSRGVKRLAWWLIR